MNVLSTINYFSSVADAMPLITSLRTPGKKLVTTNGCFDILHAGHVHYLYETAALGDILVVGINSDASVRRYKGPTRPLQCEEDRCRVIAALAMVDCAFIFPQDDPREFLSVVRPDIHVKGGDYTTDIIERTVVEQFGGRVKTVSFLAERSTTSIIRRMGTGGERIGEEADGKRS